MTGWPIPRPIPRQDIRRAVVRCPNWLGDTVMAVPAIRALRDALPEAEIACVGPWVETLLEGEDGIQRRRSWPAARRGPWPRETGPVDLAVLLPNSFGSALDAWLARARFRVGYAADGRSLLLTHAVAPRPGWCHQVDAYLALVEPLGATPASAVPTLTLREERRAEARALLATVGIEAGQRPVAIQLGAAFGPSKLWPPERLSALTTRLAADQVPVVFIGDRSAQGLMASIQRPAGRSPVDLVGRDHPALLPALLAEFAVIVAPDSGPAHVAAAVGVPVVTLFGPTDPRLTAPVGPGHAPIWRQPQCAPCFRPRCPIDHRCMTAITVDEVARAVLERRP